MENSYNKNIYLSPFRNYRKIESIHADEQKFQIIIEETDLLITIPKHINTEEAVDKCFRYISKLRKELKEYIFIHPEFQHSLEPIVSKKNAPSIVKTMCDTTKYANVGPFAAVAGSVAQLVSQMLFVWIVEKNQHEKQKYTKENIEEKMSSTLLHEESQSDNIIVENGGDIYIYSQKERVVGILSNPTKGESIGLKIHKEDFPVSICSSSSKIGHSLSFGNGDIAMVRSKNAALADALATAYCNMLKTSKDINRVIEQAQKDAEIKIPQNPFDTQEIYAFLNEENSSRETRGFQNTLPENNILGGLEGIFLQCDGHIGAWGKIELVAL